MVGQEGKGSKMAGVSLAEQVLRDLGPLEVLATKLYRDGGSRDDDTFSSFMRILGGLEYRAEQRVDKNTAEHYRRQRAEGVAIMNGQSVRADEDL